MELPIMENELEKMATAILRNMLSLPTLPIYPTPAHSLRYKIQIGT